MYKEMGFKNSHELLKWLNSNKIAKEDIISVMYDSSKSNEYWVYSLIYYSQE